MTAQSATPLDELKARIDHVLTFSRLTIDLRRGSSGVTVCYLHNGPTRYPYNGMVIYLRHTVTLSHRTRKYTGVFLLGTRRG